MSNAERDHLKANLLGMIAGQGDGIDLDTPYRWNVKGIEEAERFFRSLDSLLPADSVLYFEGCSIAREVSEFYESHRAKNPVAVVRDTISPTPDTYHVDFSPAVVTGLCELTATRTSGEAFYHIKAYRGETLLFTFHDAFEGDLLISEHIAESTVADFCIRLGVTYRQERNTKRDPEQLRRLLWALENPDQVRFVGEPWWRRAWRRWTGW
ncbi:hypothetical protein OKA04_06730 [Luteolibacter flavescens]|uniref:Uncharacterized protein n=1 Tax=Luteolibacter flavescens TaxID=1859460 RepID=A0ABT3FLH8_9BACT|nr:hypothetical protein [Luteolibacter flavescens]MCW1884420.1 hypothetical protein [Luteolibacter flavescens]